MEKNLMFVFLFLLLGYLVPAQQKPNVIFILADDLGYGDLGSYGQKRIQTPNLDHMAQRGMRFTQFYAGTTVCAPSRASLLTGKHTGHTPVRGNFEIQTEGQFPLPHSSFTIAELFKKAGYKTGAFGKWGLGFPGSEGVPNKQGFDEFFGYNCQRQSHNYFPGHLWRNEERVELTNTITQQNQYAPDLIQHEALAFIGKNKERPFFLCLAYTLPHAALQLPEDDTLLDHYKKLFREPRQDIPEWNGKGYQPHAYPLAAYAALVGRLDRYVGEIMNQLKALGIEHNTMVVFTSDNGPHREGDNRPEFFNSSGGFRGIKRDLFEGGIRVPLIVQWPAVIKKGSTSGFTGAAWDFLPTFAALTGHKLPAATDGLSLLPVLAKQGKQQPHGFLYWEFHEDGGRQAVRMGKWKGLRLDVKKDADAPILLFDLEKDPGEKTDVSALHPEVVNKIRGIMIREHTEDKNFPLLHVRNR